MVALQALFALVFALTPSTLSSPIGMLPADVHLGPGSSASSPEVPPAPRTERGGVVLFSTFPGLVPGPFSVAVQSVTDIPDATLVAADDFTVTGNGWNLQTVEVRGSYFEFLPGGPTGPADSVSVYILGDSGGFPDTTDLAGGAIYAAEGLSYDDVGSGDFRIILPGDGVDLLAGTYWLVVLPEMSVLAGGQWGWTESAAAPNAGTTNGSESVWRQTIALVPPANGGAYTCVGPWGRRITDCDITVPADPNPPSEFDLAFELRGTVLVPGVTVAPTGLVTQESGTSDTFSVVLTAPPSGGATVTVPIDTAPAAEGLVSATELMFSAANWDVPQTVSLTGVDDAVADGDVAYSLVNGPTASGDGAYAGLAVAAVGVVNQDDEAAGLAVDPVSGLTVSEDGLVTATFDVRLTTAPGAGETVTVPLSVVPGVCCIAAANLATLSTASLQFTDTNAQTVTVTGVDDDIDQGDVPFSVVTGDPSSSVGGSPYDLLGASDVADVAATRSDDDTAGFLVTPAANPLVVDETGTSATFDVVLLSEPTGTVSVSLFSSDSSEGTVSTETRGTTPPLVFDDTDWFVPQTVTVTGVDDDIDDGNVGFLISLQPAGGSAVEYQGLDPADVPARNDDDTDAAGVLLSPLVGLETDELGAAVALEVVLTSEPVFGIEVLLAASDTSEILLSDGGPFADVIQLDFSAADWDVPQILQVQGQPDGTVDGDQTVLVEVQPISCCDVVYTELAGPDLPAAEVVNLDGNTVLEIPTLGTLPRAVFGVALLLFGLLAMQRRSI